ncbi:DUF2203 domain-containing protein [Myxococcus fulvus]|uniref:DUF2203 domain-containing protein n=1 Tax=Myxococcus fulvus TaxID=33 RepID=UPI003B9B3EF8
MRKRARSGHTTDGHAPERPACSPAMRYFSVDEANRLVPLLSRTFEHIRPWVERVQQLVETLGTPEGKALANHEALREERDALLEKVRVELRQFHEMGLEIKGAQGLVDFRAHRGEEPVYLCWRIGEPAVSHWHGMYDGFSGRRPIASPDEFAPTYLS